MFAALVVSICALIYTVEAWKFIGKNHFRLKSQKSVTQLQSSYGTLGSDALIRPEDEDSPEFRVYLKKLLEMQSNRAKAGFASPSSGSSDAYFAKLTRLKLEKIARRKAGLPEEVDKSYRPEDYLAAVYGSLFLSLQMIPHFISYLLFILAGPKWQNQLLATAHSLQKQERLEDLATKFDH